MRGNVLMNVLNIISTFLLAIAGSFLLCCLFLPITALFFMWFWNEIVECFHSPYIIGYWESIKICLLFYILRGLLMVKMSITQNEIRQ